MIEMCLVMPLLLLILFFLFYFGRGLIRVQYAQVADRYVAWEQASGRVPGVVTGQPTVGQGVDQAFYDAPPYFDSSDTPQVTANVDANSGAGPLNTAADLTPNPPPSDGQSYTDLIAQSFSDFPAGVSVGMTTSYTSSMRFWLPVPGTNSTQWAWQSLERPIVHGHVREGNDWKFVNQFVAHGGSPLVSPSGDPPTVWNQVGSARGPWMLQPVTELFFQDLDSRLKDPSLSGNPVARYLINIYSGQPGYAGPQVYSAP
jgi:hypothetical protein